MGALAWVVATAVVFGQSLVGLPASIADQPRLGAPEVTVSKAKIIESAGRVRLPVRLSRKGSVDVTIFWTVVGNTAQTGPDLPPSRGRVKIRAGERTATIKIPLTDDRDAEDTESFFVYLSADGADVRKSRIKVRILDDPTDEGVRELRGPVTVSETTSNGFGLFSWTITADFRPVSPDPAAGGDWTDGGSGTWAVTGYANSPGGCAFPTETIRGTGTFTPGADPASQLPLGTGAAVLRGFRPRDKQDSPRLDMVVSGLVTTTNYKPNPDGTCTTTTTSYQRWFRASVPAEPDGLPGTVFGPTPTTRGVQFDYSNGFVGRDSTQTVARGALFPVG